MTAADGSRTVSRRIRAAGVPGVLAAPAGFDHEVEVLERALLRAYREEPGGSRPAEVRKAVLAGQGHSIGSERPGERGPVRELGERLLDWYCRRLVDVE